ncbi:glycosyltransferase family 2 protein [Bacillaceae bacterium Marseille-Q3522]|nr:glycosyltransferase family 2 protein [Bacillaceae bacterium Marseille-Q3522]
MEQPILTIVVPCYNEEEVFDQTYLQLKQVLQSLMFEQLIDEKSQLLFVDDGSQDDTWRKIEATCNEDTTVSGLKLARNFGHQKALLCGLESAATFSDCVISIDADLQDDIHVIRDFLLHFHNGCDIVYGVRKGRKTDSFFKRTTALGFYRLMEKMGIPLVYNHADYRLMSKRALLELLRFKETNLFLRGIVPLIGFKSAEVYYDRKERLAGESKYPLKKMLAFAFEGITSFSVKPIRFITMTGFLASVISIIAGCYVLIAKWGGNTEAGWASLMISIWFIGGMLLMSIGLIGEYIGKIYEEVKQRPRYIVEKNLCPKLEKGKKQHITVHS